MAHRAIMKPILQNREVTTCLYVDGNLGTWNHVIRSRKVDLLSNCVPALYIPER